MGALATVRTRVTEALRRGIFPTAPAPGTNYTPPSWWPVGWWQAGYRVQEPRQNAAVEACVSVITQTVASLPLQLWRRLPNGGHEIVNTGPIVKVLRRPNSYQSRSDFFLNLLRSELLEGNGVAVAERDRSTITALHMIPSTYARPMIAETGDVFYHMGSSASYLLPEPPLDAMWPSEDVLHIRMQTPRHPLIGESPILAAALSIQTGNAAAGHMAAFFTNMTRPSGYLSSPRTIKAEIADRLRADWERAYQGGNSGRVAVLVEGVEWKPMSISSVDSQLLESYRMSVQDVARVFRVPPVVIGEMGGATFNNTEALIRHWLATGLGFVLEHVELALDHLFRLPEDQYIAFDVEALLRSDFKTRIEGLVRGIQGGLYSPNEARGREGLPSVEFGEEPRVQAQVVPLSFASKTPEAAAPSAPTPATPGGPDSDSEGEPPEGEDGEDSEEPPPQSVESLEAEFTSFLKRGRTVNA